MKWKLGEFEDVSDIIGYQKDINELKRKQLDRIASIFIAKNIPIKVCAGSYVFDVIRMSKYDETIRYLIEGSDIKLIVDISNLTEVRYAAGILIIKVSMCIS